MRANHTFGPTAINAAKTHCVRGHEFTPENTQVRDGWRRCRKCIALRRTIAPGRNGERYSILASVGIDAASVEGQRLSQIIPEYSVWSDMRRRCQNPSHKSYAYYGGRGISVCERWESFSVFLADMGRRPSANHSIDRINNDAGYEPGNCRWATATEQMLNRRKPQRRAISTNKA